MANILDWFFRFVSFLLLEPKLEDQAPSRQFVSSGTDDFYKLVVRNGDAFVDKSLLIEEYLRYDGEVLVISRPTKWGKTVNLDMIRCFLEIEQDEHGFRLADEQMVNRALFVGGSVKTVGTTKRLKPLKIANKTDIMSVQGTYPVIYVSLKDALSDNYRSFEKRLRFKMRDLYLKYKYLGRVMNDEDEKKIYNSCKAGVAETELLETCLAFLIELLHKYHKRRVHVLVDEYDAPVRHLLTKLLRNKPFDAAFRSDDVDRTITLIRNTLGKAFKGNPYVERGFITGIFPMGKTELPSGLETVRQHNVVSDTRFGQYYGFTETDVDQLLQRYSMVDKKDRIRRWYNGYNVGGRVVYNPYAVTECLKQGGRYDSYWANTATTDTLARHLFSSDQEDWREKLQYLAADETVTVTVDDKQSVYEELSRANLFPLFLHTGYLTPTNLYRANHDNHDNNNDDDDDDDDDDNNNNNNNNGGKITLRVPNREIKDACKKTILEWRDDRFPWLRVENTVGKSVSLLAEHKITDFERWLRSNLIRMKDLKYDVRYYANIVYLLIVEAEQDYEIDPPKEWDQRYSNLLMIARNRTHGDAIVFKLQTAPNHIMLDDTAVSALAAIDDEKYEQMFNQSRYDHIDHVIKIGASFYHKDVTLKFRIDSRHYSKPS